MSWEFSESSEVIEKTESKENTENMFEKKSRIEELEEALDNLENEIDKNSGNIQENSKTRYLESVDYLANELEWFENEIIEWDENIKELEEIGEDVQEAKEVHKNRKDIVENKKQRIENIRHQIEHYESRGTYSELGYTREDVFERTTSDKYAESDGLREAKVPFDPNSKKTPDDLLDKAKKIRKSNETANDILKTIQEVTGEEFKGMTEMIQRNEDHAEALENKANNIINPVHVVPEKDNNNNYIDALKTLNIDYNEIQLAQQALDDRKKQTIEAVSKIVDELKVNSGKTGDKINIPPDLESIVRMALSFQIKEQIAKEQQNKEQKNPENQIVRSDIDDGTKLRDKDRITGGRSF